MRARKRQTEVIDSSKLRKGMRFTVLKWNHGTDKSYCGTPMEVEVVSLPFILAKNPEFNRPIKLDTSEVTLCRVNTEYANSFVPSYVF